MRQNIKKLSVLGLTFIFAALGIVGWNFSPKASGQNRIALFSLSETPQKKADETSIASVR